MQASLLTPGPHYQLDLGTAPGRPHLLLSHSWKTERKDPVPSRDTKPYRGQGSKRNLAYQAIKNTVRQQQSRVRMKCVQLRAA